MMLTRRSLIGALSAAMIAPAALAQDLPVFYKTDGAAIGGYDAVSYFAGGTPVRGLPEYSVMWKGAEWHFATAENRDAFEMNPRAYAPQFGGYCAYAMAQGELVSTDPMLWEVIDGRLYLTHSPAIERMWQRDTATFIQMAEAHWPVVLYQN